ncbi:MAG: DUF1232 domain-containing protein [Anaerolineae bacterium]|nr:DUF1232 domain-containing protein [Anaerolineae bacterium]
MTSNPHPLLGRLADLVRSARVAWRLFRDRRVPLWVKSVPLLALAYVIWPLDILADPALGLGQLDDLAVILVGLKLFISLCSSDLVRQHEHDLTGKPYHGQEVVDSTFRVLDDSEPH